MEKFLFKNLIKNDFYWQDREDITPVTIWDTLADENPIHAAVSAQTEEKEKLKSQEVINILQNHLDEGLVLDLGCGYGRIAKYLLPNIKLRGYIGIDGSRKMLKLFFDRYRDNPNSQQKLFCTHFDVIAEK